MGNRYSIGAWEVQVQMAGSDEMFRSALTMHVSFLAKITPHHKLTYDRHLILPNPSLNIWWLAVCDM